MWCHMGGKREKCGVIMWWKEREIWGRGEREGNMITFRRNKREIWRLVWEKEGDNMEIEEGVMTFVITFKFFTGN